MIKKDGEYFWNICEIWEEESTRDDSQGGHEAGGAPQGGGRAPDPRGHPVRRLWRSDLRWSNLYVLCHPWIGNADTHST